MESKHHQHHHRYNFTEQATKIQAVVRGWMTRRLLHVAFRRINLLIVNISQEINQSWSNSDSRSYSILEGFDCIKR